PVIYVPLICWWIWSSFAAGVGPLAFAPLYLAGALIWSLMEYVLHRKVFHYQASSKLGKRMFWLLHGVHHDWPTDKLRLVFPPTISLPLAAIVFGLLTVTVGAERRY